jgi:ADP-ribose pyrophosphatase
MRFVRQFAEFVYHEVLETVAGRELRFVVSRETFRDEKTGGSVTRAVIRHPGIAVIVPFVDAERVLLVRQSRVAAGAELWELPAGTIAAQVKGDQVVAIESPHDCAARELEEETGYRAGRLQAVARFFVSPGSMDQVANLFFAHELHRSPSHPDHDDEIAAVRPFSASDLARMIATGELRDAKTLVGLTYAFGQIAGRPLT